MGGAFGSRRAAALLLVACCLAGTRSGDALTGFRLESGLYARGPASAPAPATAAAPALAVSSEVTMPAAPAVQMMLPTPAPAAHVPAPAPVAQPVAPAPQAAQAVATEAPSSPAQASAAAPAPGPAAAATQSREYAAAQMLKQPPGPGAPTAPTAPVQQPKQQHESLLRRLAPVLASGPAPGARAPFATSITGEGGPPVGATPVGSMGTSTLTLTSLADVDRDAVCNDGSAAGYYYAPGTGEGANLWLVYLEGSVRTRRGCSKPQTAP